MTLASTVFKIRADNKTGRAFKQIDNDFGRLKNGAISLTGKLAGLAGAGGMGLLIRHQMKLAKETQAWSDALGVNIETLSAWNYAAKEVNLEGDKMSDIMKDVSEKIGDAFANNTGEAVQVMQRLNLSMADMAAMTPDQQLLAIAGALDQVGTRAEKIQILESMGSDLSKMLPLLEDNAAGLHDLMREAEDMGAVMSQAEADGLKKMNDTMRKIEASTNAFSQSFVLAFGDKFASTIDYVSGTALPAFKFLAEELGLVQFAVESLTRDELHARMGKLTEDIAEWETRAQKLLRMDTLNPKQLAGIHNMSLKLVDLNAEYAKLEARLESLNKPATPVAAPDMPRVGGFVEGESSGGDAKAEAAAIKDQERLRAQFERLQVSMMTEKDALAFHLEEKQMLVDEAFFAGEASHLERNEMRAQLDAEHQQKLTSITEKEAAERAAIEEKTARLVANMQDTAFQHGVGLLQRFAGENKLIAAILIGIQTTKAVKDIQIQSAAASAQVYAYGQIESAAHAAMFNYPAAAAATARAAVSVASIQSAAALGTGLAVAGGLADLYGVSQDDDVTSPGSRLNPLVTNSSDFGATGTAPMNSATTTPETQSGTIQIYLSTSNLIDEAGLERLVDDRIVPIIRDGVDNRDVILISGSSRNASELTQA